MAYRDDPSALRLRQAWLDDLTIATPCDASWDAMAGDERVRHCGLCDRQVYDLSTMTSAEATELLGREQPRPPCVRLHRRRDGTVITSDCARGVAKRKRRLALATASVACAMSAAAFGGRALEVLAPPAACTSDHVVDSVTMGEMIYDEDAHVREAVEQVDALLLRANSDGARMGAVSSTRRQPDDEQP